MVTKVRRLIEAYELSTVGQELADRWVGDGYERESLRALADRFNRRLLAANMESAGLSPLDGEVDNTYRLLTDDEVSAGMETQARRRLEREEVDPEELLGDFVSHQAIHTYLTKDREVDPPENQTSAADRLDRDRETIQRLQSRLEAVTDDTIGRLNTADSIDIGDFSVLVDVQVFCEECGQQYEIGELLTRGGCQCDSTPTDGTDSEE
ncbi:hypothetical protein halTADL_0031 [Halohasta litchfieldiae]|jgi:hypothetical protein|uniref:Uncharacterized protein n=1 Tax=Halohasta litchfieldiae TaxID=1073996 RepID=A0A1H6XUH3_9EURY|nr:rod-determining factor RdfA [Halohasta litchfieldiae]ATW86854.1 hypothetical protein halTADL_0031 [Halohasta litchfieldiae]SEJ31816.1 hypothetical protein SAMN05444271_1469 [Halohasta litchfieldiae]